MRTLRMVNPADADPKMVQKLLLRSAEILEAGWCQGELCTTHEGQMQYVEAGVVGVDLFCMRGAMVKAKLDLWGDAVATPECQMADLRAIDAVQSVLPPRGRRPSVLSIPVLSIPEYNDMICQTADQAAGMMRAAAEKLSC